MFDAACETFVVWVVQFPPLAERVLADLEFVRSLIDASGSISAQTLMMLLDLRAALMRLYAVAWQAGFREMAALFYGWYERCCRALMPFWSGGMELC